MRWDNSHFQVRDEVCQVSAERKCEPESVGQNLSFFSYHWANHQLFNVQFENGQHGKNLLLLHYAINEK